jgi:hypothetical protein
MATNVNLTRFNTVTLAVSTVYRLYPPSPAGSWYANVVNLGPGNLYLRANGDPTGATDPNSSTLPSLATDQGVPVDGKTGLGILADQAGKVSIRLWTA